MSSPAPEQLRAIDLFDGLGDRELARWANAAELWTCVSGEVVAEQGRTAPSFHLLLEGTLEAISVDAEGRGEPAGEHVAPTWLGAIAVLTGGRWGVRLVARSDVTIASIDAEPFTELTLADRRVFQRVMLQVRPVMGRITAIEQNRERLASLGTMAAGLAHELNNPAAAARRAASDLAAALDVLGSTIGHFVESGIERADAQRLVELQREAVARKAHSTRLSALDAADAEDELLEEMQALGVEEAWRLSEPLAAAGLDADWLQRVSRLAGPAVGAAVRWVAATLAAQGLAIELAESTERMSALVSAVKAYSYMDRGELVEADVHEGLETTVTVLAHKLKHTGIEVVRDYDRALPPLTMRGGELNQVWTNLIDNAIAALGESGTGRITIATALEGGCVRVDVGDDGPGIDRDLRERIFEPFFTTKDVGQGTGLGLDTARRIVVERHRGSIDVESEPGHTVFHVWLPLAQPPRSDGAIAGGTATREESR
ncbi:MAG TPA: ATP-binding protein [Solirubrobacteraceae bacterium]|nr:ATP-binding protein [Solirubrobacteraceae bacterium]